MTAPERCAAYLELTKPRITAMVLVTTGAGYVITAPPSFRAIELVATIVATAMLAGGTAALNQWYERDTDAAMRRTCRRPIPSGRIAPASALAFGAVLSALGGWGLLTIDTLAAVAGGVTWASYLCVYTPLKRRSPAGVFVGAFAGAMPPVIGAAAAHGRHEFAALALFALMFVWQIPHVYAIAMMYRDDYARGGLRMLPASAAYDGGPGRHITSWSIVLIVTSLLPVVGGEAGGWYFACALGLGLLFAYQSALVWREPTLRRARGVVLASVAYLPAVLVTALLDGVARRF